MGLFLLTLYCFDCQTLTSLILLEEDAIRPIDECPFCEGNDFSFVAQEFSPDKFESWDPDKILELLVKKRADRKKKS